MASLSRLAQEKSSSDGGLTWGREAVGVAITCSCANVVGVPFKVQLAMPEKAAKSAGAATTLVGVLSPSAPAAAATLGRHLGVVGGAVSAS